MDEFAREKLFPVIRRGMGIENAGGIPELPVEDVAEILKIAANQSILPVVCLGLEKNGIPKSQIGEKYENARMLALYRSVVREDAIARISKALDAAGIEYIFLKGAVLKDFYPETWMRTSFDIDILVKEEKLQNAVDAIENATDFKYVKRSYHDVELRSDRMSLELHFNIKESMLNIDPLLAEVWSHAVYSGEGMRWKMTPEFLVFHNVAHMCYHLTHGGLGIRPFVDLWLLRNKTSFDENALSAMLRECGIQLFYEKCCKLSEYWMGFAPEDGTLESLEKYCLSGGVLGTAQGLVVSRQREKKGLNYAFSRLFVKREVIESTYPNARGKPLLLPFYYVKRWFRLFDKKTRKSAMAELDYAGKTNEEELKAYDELLKSVGL
ncbi:MAG: nucleotidyltransferase family protein [Clostridia bacterium]|nr:nucleotidyltransferase family protein [Clostridia bacterium]